MKQNSQEYKNWKKRKDAKDLERRTWRKAVIRAAITRENHRNRLLNEQGAQFVQGSYHKGTRSTRFVAPSSFSFLKNYDETAFFFNEVLRFITNKRNWGKTIFIDISKVSFLSIDALMYLLAIVNNLKKNFRNRCSIEGNAPQDPEIRRKFDESGFYQYVNRVKNEPIQRTLDNIQIVSGEKTDPALAKTISQFNINKTGIPKRKGSFLYNTMIELMSNTHKHAYNKNGKLYPRWYCYAEYDQTQERLLYTFMDIGEGIPATVRRNFSEKIDFLKLRAENKYVISALNGDFRTATEQKNRGKGLPKIREYCSMRLIENMQIITNKANVRVRSEDYVGLDYSIPLLGTLYYWEIDASRLKREI